MNPGAALIQGLWRVVSWTLRVMAIVLLFAVTLLNVQKVPIHFFFGMQWQMPLAFVVLLCLMAGLLLGGGAMLIAQWRKAAEDMKIPIVIESELLKDEEDRPAKKPLRGGLPAIPS